MREKARVIIFMGLLLSLSIGNIVSPKNVFSSKENRYLQGKPKFNLSTIISGDYSKDFEAYTTDQFILRDNWIMLKTIGDLSLLKKDNGRIYFGKNGYLFDADKEIDEDQLIKNIDSINIFLDKMNKYDIPVTSLLIPSKSTVLHNELPLYAPVVDEDHIRNKLEFSLNKNIRLISLVKALSKNSNKYIYYKTDHHWTTQGAFYAYEYYMRAINENPLSEEDFIIKKVSDDFWGTNYRKANFYQGEPDEIYIYEPKKEIKYKIKINGKEETHSLYDETYLNKTDKYSYFLSGDKSLIEIETSVKNNKTLLVIKDSFANSFIPFLINHYEKIIVVDPRYFNMGMEELVNEKGADEVLLLFNEQNYAKEKSLFVLGM
ncbi:DHHW family protein [Proteiniborus sp. MB09-C3]|uniref:DHHW family protein n=1 Tax=Proteiniborus sp. MB09-C3 TaxID=3050072 RepID=UPI0025542D92|nr:DHHW family protein [Proteiniborus sp. MB09-C3]WIV13739.1 DHHW family protein [Proteiniborus sp. MB09-C3]